MDAPNRRDVHIRQSDAHDRDRDQTGFMFDLVGEHEHHDDRCQKDGHFEVFGNGPARKGPGDGGSGDISDQTGDNRRNDQGRDDLYQARARCFGHLTEIFVGNDCEQRADGIVDNCFPFKNRRRSGLDRGLAQQRHDDGRPRDHQYPCKQDSDRPFESADRVSREGAKHPGNRPAQQYQTPDAVAGMA